MKYLSWDFFNNFECVGSDCPNTCCRGWNIFVDDASARYYHSVPGNFGEKLRQNLETIKDTTRMRLTKDFACAFLTDENLCEIYQNLGKETMCFTCANYPRMRSHFGDITFSYLLTSCPEVTRMLLDQTTPVAFDFSENVTELPHTPPGFDWSLFNTLISGLSTSIDLLQNRSFSLSERLHLLILFTYAFQKHLDDHTDCTELIHTFSSPIVLAQLAQNAKSIPQNISRKYAAAFHFYNHSEEYKIIVSKDILTSHFSKFIKDAKNNDMQTTYNRFHSLRTSPVFGIQYENYCVYFLFCHYMSA